ncbi:MAG: hypothetical protein ACXACY_21715, partial [Candidatus Hodarchaeales archaeon]
MEEKVSDPTKILVMGLIIGLILGGIIGFLFSSLQSRGAGPTIQASGLSEDEIQKSTETFINENLVSPGVNAKVENVT